MFRGINTINLDAKGRMGVPARYRSRLADIAKGQLIVTIDTEEACLLLYPLPEWEAIEEKLAVLPSFNQAARRIQRLLVGHATELELDNQGRVLLPSELRKHASVEKQVVLIGQSNKFEIWSRTSWMSRREYWLANKTLDDLALPPELQSLSL